MDRALHAANALVCLAALTVAGDPLAAAQTGLSGLLSWRSLAGGLPQPLRPLADVVAADLRAGLAQPGVSADQRALIPQMIEAAMPAPADIIGARMDAAALAEILCTRLTDREHRLPANLALFRMIVTPALARVLDSPDFAPQLAPAFMRAVLSGLDRIEGAANATREGVARIEERFDAIPGQIAAILQNLSNASRPELVAVAARFEIAGADDLTDAALRRELEKRAEDWKALRAQVATIPETLKQLANLKGAAQAALDGARLDEVEELLARVHQVETEEAARTAELRADTALLRGKVEQAFALLATTADSFAALDPLEPAWRRVGYADRLYQHGLRYGGGGLLRAATLLEPATAERVRLSDPQLWAGAQNNLGAALSAQGERTGGADGAVLLGRAVAAYESALTVDTRAEHPVDWAMTQNNLGTALHEQGRRTGGAEGAALLGRAVAAYEAALTVRTRADHPVQWATTQNNLGNALLEQGRRTGGAEGAALLGRAVAAYEAALTVTTRADHPVDWAMTQGNLAIAHEAFADHETCTDPIPHVRAALAHVTAALEVFDPGHMPSNHHKATALRDRLLARLGEAG